MTDRSPFFAQPRAEFADRLEAQLNEVIYRDASARIPTDHEPLDEGDHVMTIDLDPRPARPSSRRWLFGALGAAAAIAVLIGVVWAAADDDSTIESADTPAVTAAPTSAAPTTATPTTTVAGPRDVMATDDFVPLEPGDYFIDPDGDATTPMRVTFSVPVKGWTSWYGAFKDDGQRTILSLVTVTNVVKDGCTDHSLQDPAIGPSVDDLATALANLKPFELTLPPTEVTEFGYSGKHLQVKVPTMKVSGGTEFADCTDGNLNSWFSPRNGIPFPAYPAEAGTTEDIVILDVAGERLMISMITSPSAPAEDIAQLQSIVESIKIQA